MNDRTRQDLDEYDQAVTRSSLQQVARPSGRPVVRDKISTQTLCPPWPPTGRLSARLLPAGVRR
ncbi:hypothetical protein [Streptomyces yangpuensis]|uniref:hypothetical protein n=1 Tax=Streptomyces yangpuensis TaxID=1648182 RepID=UPI0035D6CE19